MTARSPLLMNRRILLVDDLEAIHEDFRKILCPRQDDGELVRLEEALFGQKSLSAMPSYELVSAYQGEEGLQKVLEARAHGKPFSLAFVDMLMPPGWDGMETIQRIFEVDSDIQVVICTAFSEYTWEQIHARFGLTDRLLFLKKPFDIPEVCQLATALSEKWRLELLRRNFQVISRTTSAVTGDAFFKSLVMNLAHAFGAKVVCLGALRGQGEKRGWKVQYATPAEYKENLWLDHGSSIFHKLGPGKHGFFVQKNARDLYPNDPFLAEHNIESVLAIPLETEEGEVIGVLSLMFDEATLEENHDLSTLRILARRARAEMLRQRTEETLRQSEERYAVAVRGANDGLWDWDMANKALYLSPRWYEMLGYMPEDIGSDPDAFLKLVHPEDADIFQNQVKLHRQGQTPHLEVEARMRQKNGDYLWMLTRGLAVRDAHDRALRMAGSQTDIDARKKAEEQLLHDAFHDTLTNLPNRALFMNHVGRALERFKWRENEHFAVLYLDMDRFKVVNDSLGHQAGDHLLKRLSDRLKTCLRPGDILTRLGADEFAILMENIPDIQEATAMAKRIQESLQQSFLLEQQTIYVTASIGISYCDSRYNHPKEILRDADMAMSRAKTHGKGTAEVFDGAMHSQAMNLLKLENELRRAVKDEEFEVFYQPIVSLKDLSLVGFEALLRWRKSPVGPQTFIPLAEETGLIHIIGERVLLQSCQTLKAWRERHESAQKLTMSVNLSPIQFRRPTLAEEIANVMADHDFSPKDIRLEITESLIMENTEKVQELLAQFRSYGFRLSMDDFGTGYSSLSYLLRLPIDLIKVDRSFVSRMLTDSKNEEIIRTIVSLGKSLEVELTAEGVEQLAQVERLGAMGCDYAQGYYFAQPLNDEGAEKLLTGPLPWAGALVL